MMRFISRLCIVVEPPNIKYFEDENDKDDFSPDCSEYIPSPERRLPDSRSTSSSFADFQDASNVISSSTIIFQENDNGSTSSLGGDSLVIDNLLRIENITQSPSTVSNLSLMLNETDFVASPTVIYKKNFVCSPKKQDNTPNKLLDVTLTPLNEHKQLAIYNRDVITGQQSTSHDLEKTLTPVRSNSSYSIIDSELIQKEPETTDCINDETNNVLQKYKIEIIIEPESPNSIIDDESTEINTYSKKLSDIQDTVKEKDREEQNERLNLENDLKNGELDQEKSDVEVIFLEDSEENLIEEDSYDTENVNPLDLIDKLSSNSVNEEEPDSLSQPETLAPVIPVEPSAVNDINEFVTNDQATQVSDAENQNQLQPKKLTRKRKADPSEWRDNKNKLLKNSGQAYEGARNKKYHLNKNILPNCACKKKLLVKVKEDRLALHSDFYKLANRELQWQYIIRHVKSSNVKKSYS